MSYEGYELWLCKNGHIHECDCYMSSNSSEWKCPSCNAEREDGFFSVDETNGLPYPVSFSVEPIEGETTETCPTCNHTKTLTPPRYKIERVDPYYWSGKGRYPNVAESVAEDYYDYNTYENEDV